MNKLIIVMIIVLFPFTVLFAQEKIVNDLIVNLGVISWDEIQSDSMGKPAAHTEDFHLKMARSMAEMHGGGAKGDYHVLVTLTDKSTGKAVEDADVVVTAVAETGPEEITHELQRMLMEGFDGFGEFYKLTFKGPYRFKVDLKRNERPYTAEFERTIH